MRKLSYRNRNRLKHFFKFLLSVVLILLTILILAIVYLQRYVVYTSDGARLDFNRSSESIEISTPSTNEEDPEALQDVTITYVDPEEEAAEGKLKQLNGYYITCKMLRDNFDQVMANIEALDNTNAIMLDLKDGSGAFYYSTTIAGAKTASIDISKISDLIAYLNRNGFPMIARIPAFSDSAFALEHMDYALAIEGGALWVDKNGNYWLNPENPTVLSYLEQICKELSSIGFNEVVFDGFYFPTSGAIVYTSNLTRSELITAAAREVEDAFTGSNLTISFCTSDTAFPVDSEAGRIYVPDASGANVDKIISSMANTVADPTTQVVFLSDSRDTRFDAYGTLRPLLTTVEASIDLPE